MKSTNFAKASYQEIYDVNTVSNKVSIIGIHTPVGAKPRAMLSGFFTQYRKYRYLGCSLVATPAQRLGLNLAQLSTEGGASSVNPKDVFNPILVRGCHGDNLNSALNSIYKGSFDSEGSSLGLDQHDGDVVPAGGLSWEQMYYRMLQDPSFKKFSMNSGIKLSGLHPMVYNVASSVQIAPNESYPGVGDIIVDPTDTGSLGFGVRMSGAISNGKGGAVTSTPIFMTNRLQSLGWLDTRQTLNGKIGTDDVIPGYTTLPKIYMAVCCLPMAKSDAVVTSMRFVITHHFAFKEFNTSLTLEGASEYYDWLTTQSENNNTLKVQSDPSIENVELVSDGVF